MSAATAIAGTRRGRTGVLAFPVLVGLLFLLLVAVNVNGSSMAVLSADPDPPGLIAGEPRPVRSDEYRLRTPIALSSVAQDFPRAPWIGLAEVNQVATAHGGPTRDWSTVLKPQDWGYLALGADRGLAWSWWWSFAIGLAGTYLLLLTLTRRIALSALGAVAATFTPYAAWWTSPTPALFLGYGALAAGLYLLAVRTPRRSLRWSYAVGAGLSGAAFVVALYPPWQVSLVWVVGAVVVGRLLDDRVRLRLAASTLAVTLSAAAVPLTVWLAQNRDAVSAIAGTIYPGERISSAGTGSLAHLLDAPLNPWLAGEAGATVGADGRGGPWANLSEVASSWIALPVMALVVLAVVAARRAAPPPAARPDEEPPRDVPRWTLALLAGVTLLLLAWTLLPLPDLVGDLTLLNRVQPSRTPLALGLAQVLLVTVAAHTLVGRRFSHWGWVVGAAALTAGCALWSASRLPWDSTLLPVAGVALSGALLGGALAWTATQHRPAVGAAALAVYAALGWALVNPLQHGTAPLTENPLASALTPLATDEDNPRVVVYGGFDTVATVRAAGLESVSGTTLYPSSDLMQRLAPGQEALWNNYAQYRWIEAAPGSAPEIRQVKRSQMELSIPACDPVLLREVDPGWVVSESAMSADCLVALDAVEDGKGKQFWIYAVS